MQIIELNLKVFTHYFLCLTAFDPHCSLEHYVTTHIYILGMYQDQEVVLGPKWYIE